jgi:Kdo2-lipid IVA lauroyltransferase/acyltransferase
MLVYTLFRITILVTRPLPLWLGYRVAAGVAAICYFFFGKQRRALRANAAQVLGTNDRSSIEAVARSAFRSFGKFVIDFIHFPATTREEVHRRLVFSQWTDLDEATSSGRGAIIVTMHVGSWDLGAAALAAYDYPINVVVDTFEHPGMNDLIQGSRKKLGARVIPMERAALGALRALKRGEILAMLIDVPVPGQEITVDFFGAPAEVSSAPARVALRTGAWVIPALVGRGPRDDSVIRPRIDVRGARYQPTGDEERDVRALTRLIMGSFETMLRSQVDQWYLFHTLWPNARPANETGRILMREGGAR